MQTTLRDPGLRGLALDGKFAHKLRRRTMLGISAEDAAHQFGLGGIDDKFALDNVVPKRGHTAHPHAVTSRSNCAKDSRMLSVSRPMEVVVLNCWVTETNDTPLRSNTSTSLAKSDKARVKRSIL